MDEYRQLQAGVDDRDVPGDGEQDLPHVPHAQHLVEVDSKAATAYHEAGHAVVAALLRIEVEYVTVEETEDALGHLQHLPFAEDFRPDI